MRESVSGRYPGIEESTEEFYRKVDQALETAGIAIDEVPDHHHVQVLESVLDENNLLEYAEDWDTEFVESLELNNPTRYVQDYVRIIADMDEEFFDRDHHERCIDALTQEYLEERKEFDILLRNFFYKDRDFTPVSQKEKYENIDPPQHRDFEEIEKSDADFMAVDTNREKIEIHQVKKSDMSKTEKKARTEMVKDTIEDINRELGENYDIEWHFHIADEFTMAKHPLPQDFDQQIYTETGLGEFREFIEEMAIKGNTEDKNRDVFTAV